MSSARWLLGFDLGGGGVRCLAVDAASGGMASASRTWSFPRADDGAPFGFELDLPRMWECAGGACREAMASAGASPGDVQGIAVSALRFATVILDAEGDATFSVPNRDARAAGQAFRLAAEHGPALLQESGIWPLSIHTSARLLWLRDEAGVALEEGLVQLSLGDWLNFRLCGVRATDLSQAGCVGLFGLKERSWNWDRIDQLGLPRSLFSEVLPSAQRLGSLAAEAAGHLGLSAGTAVFMGGADTPCALLGAGAVEPGDSALIAGTTAPIEVVLEEPLIHPEGRLRSGHHVVPDRWVIESSAGTMGEVLTFSARILFPAAAEPERMLFAEASLGAPGAAGTISSLGAEVMDDRQARVPVGQLTLSHMGAVEAGEGRRNVARAMVEGLACGVRANLEQLRDTTGAELSTLRFSGGLSQSDFFAQLLADLCACEVRISRSPESSALGAAICAGVGAGIFRDFSEGARRLAHERAVLGPQPPMAAKAEQIYANWSSLQQAASAEVVPMASNFATPAVIAAHSRRPVLRGSAHQLRMLVTADLDSSAIERLRQHGEVVHRNFRDQLRMLSGEGLIEELADFEVFITEIDIVDAEVLRACPALRVVGSCRGDAVNIDLRACTALGIPALHAPGRNAEAVADLTLAFLLALARRLPDATRFLADPSVPAGDKGKMGQAFMEFRGRELWGNAIGLVGFGAVGRAVARRLRGFGARILVSDPYVDPAEAVLLGAEVVALPELLRESQFVSLHAAVTEDTRGLLGAAELASMRPGACLINTARAALVDEEALLARLEEGALAGAALDTFAVEPPGFDHPLVGHARVITTPHIGGNTQELAIHQGRIITAGFEALLAGTASAALANPEILGSFDWQQPRRDPAPAEWEALVAGKAPAVSDLDRDRES